MKVHMEEENNFIKYYSSLNFEEKKDLLQEIINAKKTNTSSNFTEKVDFFCRRLMMNCCREKLTSEENDLFLALNARYIINNIQLDDNLLNEYVNKYLSKNPQYTGEEIIIFLNYIRCFLNSFFNKEIVFDFQNRFHCDYEFGVPIESGLQNMMVNVCVFRKVLDEVNTMESYFCNLTYISFAMLHEYAHLLQNDYIGRYNNDTIENYLIEARMMKDNKNFYNRYHDYFDTEHEADSFAFVYTKYFLKNIIPADIIEYHLERIKQDCKTINTQKREIFELEKEKRKKHCLQR